MAPSACPRVEGRPLVLGHRGASAEAPENTMAAFHRALAGGADGVELDVWRCASGEPVVVHDASLARTAGAERDVRAASWAELRALDAGAWKGERWRGERIPLLAEVLSAFPRAVVNVELKSEGLGDPRLALSVVRLIRQHRAAERVLVSSFDYALLAAVRLAAPEVPVGLLFGADQRWELRETLGGVALRPSAVHPELALASDFRVAAWLRRGLAVNVWTVDDPAEIGRLVRAGATALVCNAPGPAREAVRRAAGR
jgi:glycerophosphoryl diester phosphodiesterase